MAYSESIAKLFPQILKESLDSGDVSHNDLYKWLCDAVCEYGKTSGASWCYLRDFIGDGESGDVIICCDGDLKKCAYQVSNVSGKISVQLDDENVMDVLPHTIYEEEADEEDHLASMESAGRYRAKNSPLYERFISKPTRDAADSSSFAGKGRSFPILKAGDVMAAVRSMGRAGSDNYDAGTLKKNIIRIAKAKGFGSSLPKAWQSGDSKESAAVGELIVSDLAHRLAEAGANPFAKKAAQAMHDKAVKSGNQKIHDSAVKMGADCPPDCKLGDGDDDADEAARVEITGDVVALREGAVGQDGTVLLKVIQPGWGSCGYYSESVLERDLPQIYPAGTKNFWNHQTEAEEAARPEGDLRDLASVTTEPVKYLKNGPDGPGGYVRAKAIETFKQPIEELAKYIGTSIRASGKAKEGVAPDGKKGKIIEQLTHGVSIDYVTTPGAGGRVLQLFEAARGRAAQPQQQQESDMTEAEQKQLREAVAANATLTAEIRKLKERDATRDAGTVVAAYLKTTNISEAIATRVTGRVLAGNIPLTEAGDLDQEKLRKFAETQLLDELEFLKRLNPSLVQGMGPSTAAPAVNAKEAKVKAKEAKKEAKEADKRFASLMSSNQGVPLGKMGRKILSEGRAAFDVNYNSRLKGVPVTGELGSLPQGMEA